MSQGAAGGLTRQKSRQHSKNKNYYTNYVGKLAARKLKRAAARQRWLLRRIERRSAMATAWSIRHSDTGNVATPVVRYGIPFVIQTKGRAYYARQTA